MKKKLTPGIYTHLSITATVGVVVLIQLAALL